jgi:uncharacterized protein (DUF1697 family)
MTRYVAFLRAINVGGHVVKMEIDDFHVHGREMYWLCRRKQSDSTFFKVGFEKTVGRRSTVWGANTIKKIVAKYCSSN